MKEVSILEVFIANPEVTGEEVSNREVVADNRSINGKINRWPNFLFWYRSYL